MRDRYLVTGGAGFIGINLAAHYLELGKVVTILDSLARVGSEENLRWLRGCYGDRFQVVRADIRGPSPDLDRAVEEADVVFHLAAQVAVTTSVVDPVEDFAVNARGTLNVLEAVRRLRARPVVVYSSTNKVYGELADLRIVERDGRYEFADLPHGVPETRSLDFHSPYGCSKGAADQYVIDYSRIYGLETIVFRQSCIFGEHQFGVEDQGWVAWFAIRALQRQPVTIYGDGRQIRDVLYVGDLIAAYDAALEHLDTTRGRAYNIGGGPANTLSLLELIDLLEVQLGYRLEYTFDDWRPGDQRVFVSDVRRAQAHFGWSPMTSPSTGVGRLSAWLAEEAATLATL
jgi:CDP-paratose 2-epimerase